MDCFICDFENSSCIKIVEEFDKVPEILQKSSYLSQIKDLNWDFGQSDLILTVENEEVKFIIDSVLETYIIISNEDLFNRIFESIQNLKEGDSDLLWEESAHEIIALLQSNDLFSIKKGLKDLNRWVNDYNDQYVNDTMNSANLSLFGYDEEGFDLMENPLFDNLLEKYKNELSEQDLLHLLGSLLNRNEEYINCKATYTCIQYLLENPSLEVEQSIVKATVHAMDGHEPGHRSYENGLMDKLVDEVFPSFSVTPILTLLENIHADNLFNHHMGGRGDNFISLAYIALDKGPNPDQEKRLKNLIHKYGNKI